MHGEFGKITVLDAETVCSVPHVNYTLTKSLKIHTYIPLNMEKNKACSLKKLEHTEEHKGAEVENLEGGKL